MGKMLLGLAAAIAATTVTTPALAGTPEDAFVGIPNANLTVGFSGLPAPGFSHGVTIHSGFGFGSGFGHHGRSGRSSGGSSGGIWVNGGEWAHYNNQAFNSSSYNDWWHESPRSQPAWVRNNQDCSRQWFAGDVLRC